LLLTLTRVNPESGFLELLQLPMPDPTDPDAGQIQPLARGGLAISAQHPTRNDSDGG
jgi:hypothetical protein